MKNNSKREFHSHETPEFRRFYRFLKKSTFCLCFGSMALMAENVYAQNAKVTINQKNVQLVTILDAIESQTDYLFVYKNDVDVTMLKSINVEQQSVSEVLQSLLLKTGFTYRVEGNHIILTSDSTSANLPLNKSSKKQLKGKVVDSNGEPIIGATIKEVNGNNGTITDLDGNFSLSVSEGTALSISFIGYKTQIIKVRLGKVLRVLLKEDNKLLDEVVVVGFGTQKKTNLTGAVSVVSSKELQERPVTNLSQALQGIVPGLQISQSNGSLESSPTINIRGIGTIDEGSSGAPLVLIDGVEGDINMVNPQDVENISVLKDAAASSIYGSRAPFGVILITTKSGAEEGKISINYNNNFRFSKPTKMVNMMHSVDFASWMNDHFANAGAAVFFDEKRMNDIVAYHNAKPYGPGQRITNDGTILNNITSRPSGLWADGYRYGIDDVDWVDAIFKDYSFSHEHSFSVNGGNKNFNYYASFNYLSQNGMLEVGKDKKDRYLGMVKINSEITDWFRFNYNMRFTRNDYNRPSRLTSDIYVTMTTQGWPMLPLYDPNGYLYSAPSPALGLSEGGIDKIQEDNTFHQLGFTIEPIKKWITHLEFNYRTSNSNRKWDIQKLYNHDTKGNPVIFDKNSHVHEENSKTNYWNLNIYSEYTHSFNDKHNFHVLAGFQAEENDHKYFSAERDGVMFTSKPWLDLTSGMDYNGSKTDSRISGNMADWATAGFFGRMNYDYLGRYLFEVNVRGDGTSRFRKNNRWRVFPSVSLGWNIAQESFFDSVAETVNTLKLRGSFGSLGNQNTHNPYQTYQILKMYSAAGGWPMGGAKPNVAKVPELMSPDLGWETIQNYNIGLDWGALNNRFTGSIEYFIRDTKNMVGYAPELPNILGARVPVTNNTDLRTKGWELTIGWKDHLENGLNYSATFNLSDARTKITCYPNNPTKNIWSNMEGRYTGEIWGYTTKGLAHSDQEMLDHLATLPHGGQDAIGNDWQAGDIMYKDLNGDGKISSGKEVLGDSGDLTVIGNNTPRYLLGLDLNASWKGFDIRAFFQGVMKRDFWQGGTYMFGSGFYEWACSGITDVQDYFRDEDSWSVQHGHRTANIDAYLPRPLFSYKNRQCQTRYLQNAAYLRLKNFTVGYTLPRTFTHKCGVQNVRLFLSGENLWTLTGVSNQFDPETLTGGEFGGVGYPLSKTVSLGLSLTL